MKQKIKGTVNCPRLYIFKSNKHLYAQIIDDSNNNIITGISSISKEINQYANCKVAKKIGYSIAKKLQEQGIKKIIFDRGSNIYHGQIKELADATRDSGINF